MKKYHRGYTSGVYDLFHVGHLNLLKHAKEMCDFLIVGVSTDDVVKANKHKKAVIPFEQRAEIVSSIKYVDQVVAQTRYDADGKIEAATKYNADVVFVGSDWEGTKKWEEIEARLKRIGVDVVYLKHTDGISSTIIRETLHK